MLSTYDIPFNGRLYPSWTFTISLQFCDIGTCTNNYMGKFITIHTWYTNEWCARCEYGDGFDTEEIEKWKKLVNFTLI